MEKKIKSLKSLDFLCVYDQNLLNLFFILLKLIIYSNKQAQSFFNCWAGIASSTTQVI